MNSTIKTSLDVGNGFLKGNVNIDMENISNQYELFFQTTSAIYNEEHILIANNKEDITKVINNLENEVISSVASNVVTNSNKKVYGTRAINMLKQTTFDVNSYISKAKQELMYEIMFTTLATQNLKNYYKIKNELPNDIIKSKIMLVTALPIAEYKQYRDVLKQLLTNSKHMVTIYNFENPIIVELEFVDVKVISESACGNFALSQNFEILRESGASDILRNVSNSVSIDIGDGTVNFCVFKNNEFMYDVSETISNGYGTFLDRVNRKKLKPKGFLFNNRKQLSEFLYTEPTELNLNKHNKIKEIVNEEMEQFADMIVENLTTILNESGSDVECIYVYGGASIGLKEILQPKLEKTLINFNNIPNIYIDKKYAQKLNAIGLHLVAQEIFSDIF